MKTEILCIKLKTKKLTIVHKTSVAVCFRSACGADGQVRITEMEIPLKYDDISFNLHNLGKSLRFESAICCMCEMITPACSVTKFK